MEDNLEIYFCEICSESVPVQDIRAKTAREIKGKVIGACCLPDVAAPAQARGGSPVGLTTLGIVLLAGVAAATVFLDSRFTDEVDQVRREMATVSTTVSSQGDLWSDLEKRLDHTLQAGALQPVQKQIAGLEGKIGKVSQSLSGEIRGSSVRFAGLEETQKRLVDGQTSLQREIKDVVSEVLRVGRDVAAVAAAPRPAPQRAYDAGSGDDPGPAVRPAPAAADAGLPATLAHQVGRLKDKDAGNRFEAVDQLIQSKHPKAREHLVPMLKDPDPFVRRLTAEGLGGFKHAATVDALLVALADPESIVRHTAHASLKKLTGQSIAFDPDAGARARATAQRRWKEWWSKNRGKF